MKTQTTALALILGSSLVFAATSSAQVGVDSIGANIEVISPAAGSINSSSFESDFDLSPNEDNKIKFFYEGTTTLTSDLDVYLGTPPTPGSPDVTLTTGTKVRSYLLHWNPTGTLTTTNLQFFDDATINFTNEVLGFLGTPSELAATDNLTGMNYIDPAYQNNIGRSAGFRTGNDAFGASTDSFGNSTVFRVDNLAINNDNVDHIRIFTAVPEPATVIGSVLALGLVGYQGLRRRRKAAVATA